MNKIHNFVADNIFKDDEYAAKGHWRAEPTIRPAVLIGCETKRFVGSCHDYSG